MNVPRFYVEALSAGRIRLPQAEGIHASKSRRLSVNDQLILFDGKGQEGTGRIVSISKDRIDVEVEQVIRRAQPAPSLTLSVALPKGPRQDLIIEKCTELGVSGIQPIFTERSVCSASDHKREKWRRKIIEAAKQSGQCWLPTLYEPRSLKDVIYDADKFDLLLLAVSPANEIEGTGKPTEIVDLLGEISSSKTILALVGPEGGWTDAEINTIIEAGGRPVSLGPNILRIETAAVALAAMIHALSQ
ncbi:MAG: 16S rRNA (uracil(1498)-N(3))-methyltransferase [Planctomycetota bacterium]|nr:MAG: 16S rRNA (uracil(1498)-N(3))-methyltransferase [Planctomycetota bacterium]